MTEQQAEPDAVLDHADPGDDTQRRFRYQAAYAAVLAANLLDDPSEAEAVYCEHHDDVLIKFSSGLFRAVQVKTSDQSDPVKADHESVVSSLARFVRLDQRFPGKMVGFEIATNHRFYSTNKNGKNLAHLLVLASTTNDSSNPTTGILKTFLNRIAKASFKTKKPTNDQRTEVLSVLARTTANDRLPKMGNIEAVLANRLGMIDTNLGSHSLPELRAAAQSLVDETLRASSLQDDSTNNGYAFVATSVDGDAHKTASAIREKTFTRERVRSVLQDHFDAATPLAPKHVLDPKDIPNDLSVMEKKLVAGGLSTTTITSAHDCVNSAQVLGARLLHRYGQKVGLAKYADLQTTVQRECAGAHEAAFSEEKLFGRDMYLELERRLKERSASGTVNGTACKTEHLLGHAYSLTNDCKVWWSPEFEVGDD